MRYFTYQSPLHSVTSIILGLRLSACFVCLSAETEKMPFLFCPLIELGDTVKHYILAASLSGDFAM